MCAALSARERGAQVTLLERAPFDLRGGNTRFTAGAMRAVYDGVDDLVRLMPDLTASEIERTDFSSYSSTNFFDDLGRVTQYRCDPALAERLRAAGRLTAEANAEERLDRHWAALLDGFVQKGAACAT